MWKKEKDQLCPEIHYQKLANGIRITGCYGTDGFLVLPDEIEGQPVTEIGAYAFARKETDAEDEVWLHKDAHLSGERHRICGEEVRTVWLPAGVTEIGRYAFYRCKNLKRLILTDSLLELGGGALTGCRLSEVELHFIKGEKSCLKSIVDEIRFAIRAELHYHLEQEEARVLFPEHYEEAVENTPARILETHHHGAGGYYRQCFYNRELDYKKYDATLFRAVAEEEPQTAELVLNRLRFPYRLSGEAKEAYGHYLAGHMEDALRFLTETEDREGLRFLMAGEHWDGKAQEQAVELAAKAGKTELLSLLMDAGKQKIPVRRKTFEL